MNPFLPLISAVLQTGAFTLDKVIISFRRVDFRTYNVISFFLGIILLFIAFLIIRPPLSFDLFDGPNGFLILVSAGLIVFINLVYYRALKYDGLGEMETLDLFRNIPVIIFSSVIFVSERNTVIIALALLAIVAVIWSHWEKHHFKVARRTWPFLLGGLITAPIGAVVSKELLATWHPLSLDLVRSTLAALVMLAFFGKYMSREVSAGRWKNIYYLAGTTFLSWLASLIYLYSYQRSGIVYTVLLFSIQPLLVYIVSVLFFKEKTNWKKILAFCVVLGAIITAQIMQ